MSLTLSISPASETPIFRQIGQQIQRAISHGQIRVGEQLPAVRQLAELLVVNANTVARAYQELIRDGVLESRTGRGVFVAARRTVFSPEESARRLAHAAEQLCHEALLLGANLTEIRRNVDAQWQDLQRRTREINPPEKGRQP
jgi:GntR family transcriptional regulator